MMQPSNPFSGLPKVFWGLLIIGALATLAFINSDLVNPITSFVKAERYRLETAQQKQLDDKNQANEDAKAKEQIAQQKAINAIDVKIKNAEAKAQIAKIAADQAAYPKLLAQQQQHQDQQAALELEISRQQAAFEFEKSRLVQYGMIGAGMILVICFSVVMIQSQRRRLVLAQTQTQVKRIDRWQDPTWRENQVTLARKREQSTRIFDLGQTRRTSVPAFYITQEEEAPIAWEDLREQFAMARKTQKPE